MIHEPFFHDDRFFQSVEDFMIYHEIDEENIEEVDDVYTCFGADLQPIVKLSADWIIDRIDDERFSEEGEEADNVYELLKTIDFDAINEKIPKLWYENRNKFELTKADLYEALK